jgi:hypothetical protein
MRSDRCLKNNLVFLSGVHELNEQRAKFINSSDSVYSSDIINEKKTLVERKNVY